MQNQIDINAQLNTVELKDSAWVNPWIDSKPRKLEFLTTETFQTQTLPQEDGESDVFEIALFLRISDTQILRSRTVYNVIDLIADVSGIADILLVFSTTIMSLLITQRAFETALVQHIGKVYLTKSPKKKYELSDLFGGQRSWTPSDRLLLQVINDIGRRGKLRMNVWLTLLAQCLPRKWRS